MRTKEIKDLLSKGLRHDVIFQKALGDMGCFGYLFGHRQTKTNNQRIKRTWKRISNFK